MQAVVKLSVSHGSTETIVEDDGASGDLTTLPLMGQDVSPNTSAQTNPIRVKSAVPNTSFDRVFRLKLTDLDGSTSVGNFKFWAGTQTPSTDCTLFAKVTDTYTQPVGDNEWTIGEMTSIGEYAQVPVSAGTTIDGTLTVVDTYTDYVYLKLHVAQTQTSGGNTTIYVSYDEIS